MLRFAHIAISRISKKGDAFRAAGSGGPFDEGFATKANSSFSFECLFPNVSGNHVPTAVYIPRYASYLYNDRALKKVRRTTGSRGLPSLCRVSHHLWSRAFRGPPAFCVDAKPVPIKPTGSRLFSHARAPPDPPKHAISQEA